MKSRTNIISIILGGLLIISLLVGGFGYRHLKKRIKKDIKQKEQEIKDSQRRQDSLTNLVDYYKIDADHFKDVADKLNIKNRKLYEELKQREKDINRRDTSFTNNASLISESIHRYYK